MSSFDSLSLDEGVELIQSRVALLSRPAFAAFFGSIGAAMIPIYTHFSDVNRWGDVAVLHRALDGAFAYATGVSDFSPHSGRILEQIEEVTPDGDDFETPESLFAMDVTICIDAALRASIPDQKVEPSWVEFALDPMTTTLCEEQTGFLQLGSDDEDVWRAQALRNPALNRAFESAIEIVNLLLGRESPIDQKLIETLMKTATRLVPSRYAEW